MLEFHVAFALCEGASIFANYCKISAPTFKRLLPLCQKLMPLIDRGHSGDSAGLVIEDLVCDVRRDAKPRHPGHARSTQIVKHPVLYIRQLIEPSLCAIEPLIRFRCVREDI